jgi:RNA-binding protein 25
LSNLDDDIVEAVLKLRLGLLEVSACREEAKDEVLTRGNTRREGEKEREEKWIEIDKKYLQR